MNLQHQRMILGYHGCEEDVAERVLRGEDVLKKSQNTFDWLGEGIYFWEYGVERALHFAKEQIERKEKRGQATGKPAVLGAVIQLGRCFDLLDIRFSLMLRDAYQRLRESGKPLPSNRPNGLHDLDCAVFNHLFQTLDAQGDHYQSVRGLFIEGEPVFEGSKVHEKAHIQIAIRDVSCVIGYFRPSQI